MISPGLKAHRNRRRCILKIECSGIVRLTKTCRDALRTNSDSTSLAGLRLQPLQSEVLYHLRIYHRTQPLLVTTTGRMGLLEQGRRRTRRGTGGSRTFWGLRAGQSNGHRRQLRRGSSTSRGRQYIPRDYGPDGVADGLSRSTPHDSRADASCLKP